ncbi:MAG: sigma-54-dependent Fis family transcriptional regulator [Calditrichaeota bacterium]|nr:sigma-54-dependent Fis family transcriptional regulator [Calditrichota bacterium]
MDSTFRLLIVDNEEKMCTLLKTYLTTEKLEIVTALSGEEAIARFKEEPFDVVLTDLKMPGKSGLDVLDEVLRMAPETSVVLMTAFATAQTAVQAMKKGAYDYLIKPFDFEEVRLKIERILKEKALQQENVGLREQLQTRFSFENIIGHSGAMQDVFKLIKKVANTDTTVLIRGESGTGKELIALAIHRNSHRAEKPFVAVNCAAIPENLLESELFGYEKGAFTGADRRKPGRFELSADGTIFLDEIGDLSPALQAKILRVLQNKTFERLGGTEALHVKARIIAATHRDLEAAVKDGHFREDLYYRINVFPIFLPPLRKRKEDIPELTEHFAAKYSKRPLKITPTFIRTLQAYHWPGNVRELENIIERAVILADHDELTTEHLPPHLAHGVEGSLFDAELPDDGIELEKVEIQLIRKALAKSGGNKSKAAQLLGITRRKLYSMMERLKIEP